MPHDRLREVLRGELAELEKSGRRKGAESEVVAVLPPEDARGPRVRLADAGERPFLRMNSNGYLGLATHPDVVAAEERASRRYGVGPQAVRFISGTFAPHRALEARLAAFHAREAGMIFSSAYATVMGVLAPLLSSETVVISDALNHNCIINAVRLARPAERVVAPHLELDAFDAALANAAGKQRRAVVVTDGVFSMRGDFAPLERMAAQVAAHDAAFPENALLVVDDSHGVGALGATGRGTEEETGGRADLLIATLGKAFGVNGGYVVGDAVVIEWLRESSPYYVYSNPITPGEAAAALAAVEVVDGAEGRTLLTRLRERTEQFEAGLVRLGYETIPGPHPVVPLLVRDTGRTQRLVAHLREHGVLATGLAYPVVPRGEEEIRFQHSAAHTEADVDEALAVLEAFPERGAVA